MADILTEIKETISFLLYAIYRIIYSAVLFFVPAAYEPVKTVKGETILITGAGSGIGRLLAVKLAKLNAKIVIWDINVKGLEETVQMVKKAGGTIFSYKCDLTQRDEVYQVAQKVKDEVGEVTILINNAGFVSGYYLLETPDHLIQRTFDVNSLAMFWTTKTFLPDMIKKRHGHIVTIASMAAHVACPKLVDYCASKYAAFGFDEGLRLELAAQGHDKYIKTTVVCPFFISSTGMFNDVVSKSPALPAETVAERIVLGILREDYLVMLPRYLRYIFWFKWIVPWPVISRMMIDLVPDASPSTNQS